MDVAAYFARNRRTCACRLRYHSLRTEIEGQNLNASMDRKAGNFSRKIAFLICSVFADLVGKSRKEIVKTLINIIKIISSFHVVCRKLGSAFFIGVL